MFDTLGKFQHYEISYSAADILSKTVLAGRFYYSSNRVAFERSKKFNIYIVYQANKIKFNIFLAFFFSLCTLKHRRYRNKSSHILITKKKS